MPDLKIRKLWGRVDLLYERRASEIVDRRGQIARAAVAHDPAFFQYTITDDGAIVQAPLSEININSSFASCIWRDDHKRSGLLEFIESQITAACVITQIRCYSIYARPSVLSLDEMIQSMRAGTDWKGFGLADRSELVDVALTYTVKREGPPFTAKCGPMGRDQLKFAVYGTLQQYAPDTLPSPVWFLNLAEKGWSPLPDRTTMSTVRRVIGERFNMWGEFADEFLKGE